MVYSIHAYTYKKYIYNPRPPIPSSKPQAANPKPKPLHSQHPVRLHLCAPETTAQTGTGDLKARLNSTAVYDAQEVMKGLCTAQIGLCKDPC